MPEEILRLQERAATADLLPRREAIRNRVSAILPLYQLSRYRPTGPPTQRQARSNTNRTRNGRTSPQSITPDASTASAPDRPRAPSQAEAMSDPTPDMPQTHDSHSEGLAESMVGPPDVAWISARDGSRAPGDLEDQAARYHPGRHELTINADFRAISDLIAHWQARYRGVPGAHAVIDAQVREWCEQILAEVVLAARNSSWSHEQLHALLSPTSFTAALLPRHLLHATLQKRLGQKLGTPRSMAEEPASVDMGPCHSPRPRDRGDTTQPRRRATGAPARNGLSPRARGNSRRDLDRGLPMTPGPRFAANSPSRTSARPCESGEWCRGESMTESPSRQLPRTAPPPDQGEVEGRVTERPSQSAGGVCRDCAFPLIQGHGRRPYPHPDRPAPPQRGGAHGRPGQGGTRPVRPSGLGATA